MELGKGEYLANGMAVTRTASYAITSKALYKLVVGSDGRPRVVWRAGYDHSVDKSQLGQLCVGSGTSPTILGGGKYVTINDSATPMKVLVFRTATKLKPGQRRLIGSIPVFADMAGQAAANSILGYRDSMVIQNSYGHSDAYDKDGFLRSTDSLPGLERIDIKPGGKGLRKVWVNDEVTSVNLPKLSTQTGLIYVIDRQDDESGRRRVLLDGRRLPHRQGGVAQDGRQGRRLGQLLRAVVPRPDGHVLQWQLRRACCRAGRGLRFTPRRCDPSAVCEESLEAHYRHVKGE